MKCLNLNLRMESQSDSELKLEVETEGGTAAKVGGRETETELIAHYGCIFSGLVGAVAYHHFGHLPNNPSSIMKCN